MGPGMSELVYRPAVAVNREPVRFEEYLRALDTAWDAGRADVAAHLIELLYLMADGDWPERAVATDRIRIQ